MRNGEPESFWSKLILLVAFGAGIISVLGLGYYAFTG